MATGPQQVVLVPLRCEVQGLLWCGRHVSATDHELDEALAVVANDDLEAADAAPALLRG